MFMIRIFKKLLTDKNWRAVSFREQHPGNDQLGPRTSGGDALVSHANFNIKIQNQTKQTHITRTYICSDMKGNKW